VRILNSLPLSTFFTIENIESVQKLGLYSNSIGTAGATALAAALPSLTALTTLHLGNYGINATALYAALATKFPSVEWLKENVISTGLARIIIN
jgi:hypothetical protein